MNNFREILAVIFLGFAVYKHIKGEYPAAIYNMLWVIFLTITMQQYYGTIGKRGMIGYNWCIQG